jgi:hypothetical protein
LVQEQAVTRKQPEVRRVLIAVTEANSVPDLLHEVTEHLAEEAAELVLVFLNDDRWRKAASLPFTREVFRISGVSTDFTSTRAEQVHQEVIDEILGRLRQFATDAKTTLAFETIPEQEAVRLHDLLTSDADVLVAPSSFRERPIYKEITRLKCRLRFVEPSEAARRS